MPEARTDALRIQVVPRRDVREIRVLNAHNRTFNDRAAREVRVTLVREREVVASVDHTFEALEPAPTWVTIPIGGDAIDEVILHVRSFHGRGGGLAEVTVE